MVRKKRKKRHMSLKKKHLSRKIKHLSRKIQKNKNTRKKKKKTFVIVIVSVPLSPNKKYFKVCGDSYIASSHLSWMKRQGIIPLVIPYDTKDLKYYFKRIHGLYLPSGGAFAGTQQKYYNCCKKLMLMAMKENDRGCHFPIWGCCMGFQQMLILADGNDDVDHFLQKFDSYKNFLCNIKFTEEGKHSRFVRGIGSETYDKLRRKKCTMNNHKLGITPQKMKNNKKVHSFYKIIGTSKDRKGRDFVAIIEARHYPFWGVQWHPERNGEMDALIKYFSKVLKKSKRKVYDKIHYNKYRIMHTKKIDCMNYSENLYKKCNFYWHDRTSAHNKKLCNIAQLNEQENIDGSGAGV